MSDWIIRKMDMIDRWWYLRPCDGKLGSCWSLKAEHAIKLTEARWSLKAEHAIKLTEARAKKVAAQLRRDSVSIMDAHINACPWDQAVAEAEKKY